MRDLILLEQGWIQEFNLNRMCQLLMGIRFRGKPAFEELHQPWVDIFQPTQIVTAAMNLAGKRCQHWKGKVAGGFMVGADTIVDPAIGFLSINSILDQSFDGLRPSRQKVLCHQPGVW